MNSTDRLSRRRTLQLTGLAGTALLAGCQAPVQQTEPEADDAEGDEPVGWENVEEIVLEGHFDHWIGVEPPEIADEENPTLVLYAGREYELTWENGDGDFHNLVIWDEDDNALEETDYTDEEGATETLTFEASEEMVRFVCAPHVPTMDGAIEVRTE
ncbi:cupredoxin domain-containing protein [Natronosalvus vescus]|uniref:cupredoxin domain-containing protein n=1 Tax=Natronosalvus vescus TaxID=2953881 RepID=UPI002090D230|nr:plastocyanin/azurin family copper-binding protein [Natronosalvus vescus]